MWIANSPKNHQLSIYGGIKIWRSSLLKGRSSRCIVGEFRRHLDSVWQTRERWLWLTGRGGTTTSAVVHTREGKGKAKANKCRVNASTWVKYSVRTCVGGVPSGRNPSFPIELLWKLTVYIFLKTFMYMYISLSFYLVQWADLKFWILIGNEAPYCWVNYPYQTWKSKGMYFLFVSVCFEDYIFAIVKVQKFFNSQFHNQCHSFSIQKITWDLCCTMHILVPAPPHW